MKELERILRLENYKIIKIEERNENKKMIKVFYVESKNKKDKCPVCNEYTSSIHDKLKPIEVKYLKVIEQDTKINIIKKRFVCHKCNKRFTENLDLNQKGKTISNKLEQKVLKDLLNYNLSIKYIADINGITSGSVRNILLNAMSEYPEHVRNLPRVISFDEFKADTSEGKYAFIINDPIHRKALDILSERKKEYLLQYFTHCNNRHSVEFVISDMYEPYILVQKIMFPHAKYVVDRFHIVAQANNAFKCTRVQIMKKDKKNYKKLKHYWKLLQKCELDLDNKKKKYSNYFKREITEYDIVQYLINTNKILKETYNVYQGIIKSIRNKDSILFIKIIEVKHNNISEYMKNALKTYKKFKTFIINSLKYDYNNGLIEGTKNLIKCIKRIAFGYKSFSHFKTRILLITGIYKIAY